MGDAPRSPDTVVLRKLAKNSGISSTDTNMMLSKVGNIRIWEGITLRTI